MNTFQTGVVAAIGLVSLVVAMVSINKVIKNHNPYGQTGFLFWLGIFVWGDGVILGFFWSLASLICILLNDWMLFWLLTSVFWVVRSWGEVSYWISQQFSPIVRNTPKNLAGYRWFKNDSIWFVYQLFWQCVLVISILMTIYLANRI